MLRVIAGVGVCISPETVRTSVCPSQRYTNRKRRAYVGRGCGIMSWRRLDDDRAGEASWREAKAAKSTPRPGFWSFYSRDRLAAKLLVSLPSAARRRYPDLVPH